MGPQKNSAQRRARKGSMRRKSASCAAARAKRHSQNRMLALLLKPVNAYSSRRGGGSTAGKPTADPAVPVTAVPERARTVGTQYIYHARHIMQMLTNLVEHVIVEILVRNDTS